MESSPFFTIFIPVYNRANTIERLLKSIERQTFRDFECIIINDGSKDDSEKVINSLKKKLDFKLRYYYQENSGKHVARNKALDLAKGKMFFSIDSDDVMMSDCLQLLFDSWLPVDNNKEFAGVEGNCLEYGSSKIIGQEFPNKLFDSDHISTRYTHEIKGDKIRCILTSVFKEHKFPVYENEKFIPESTVWNRIGKAYKMRYINHALAQVEYQKDGISSNSLKFRTENSLGSFNYYKEFLIFFSQDKRVKKKYIYKNSVNYYRFGLHNKMTLKKLFVVKEKNILEFPLILLGMLTYIRDKKKLR
ncbi:hypothetical protein BBH88_07245 [Planococcus antarcticus DSM 14505]|uniref:Glycosyltransferase 2-like domain-containing protein n=1 Tax=Planococcus antarcticus DSM 14505 TaxID=1185653 RepID=A0ABM6D4D8_9BACL|nr:glycosyltransferase family 2 protein [Planococcus antarcticus]ANU10112.1 hypothetical protein BBH88_07245 [Planococcus antarcticus DSM 14505]